MRISFLLFLLLPIYLFGQHQIEGKVIDEKTEKYEMMTSFQDQFNVELILLNNMKIHTL